MADCTRIYVRKGQDEARFQAGEFGHKGRTDMRILLTGANGFLGTHLTNALKSARHEFLLLDHTNMAVPNLPMAKFLQCDLSEIANFGEEIRKFHPQAVVHLAWQGIPDFSPNFSILNLLNSIQFLDLIVRETNCSKIIISGSCVEYGAKQGACTEDECSVSTSYLGWAKKAIYDYARVLCEKTPVDLIWFRIFYVYGPGQRANSLIPTLVRAFSSNVQPMITNPFNSNDFIFVDDVIEAFFVALENQIPTGVYNLGSGAPTSVYEVCRIVEEIITGRTKLSDMIRPRSDAIGQSGLWACMDRTESTLQWTPRFSLKEGITAYMKTLNSIIEKNK